MEILWAIVWIAVGIALDRVLGQVLEDRARQVLRERHYRKVNAAWQRTEASVGTLQVVQSGWLDGLFPEDAVTVTLKSDFNPLPQLAEFRAVHHQEWIEAGMHDGRQVGLSAVKVSHDSDEPDDARSGRSHSVKLTAHEYSYFDLLASHALRLTGSDAERAVLDAISGSTPSAIPIAGFPTPLSVGLAILADGGSSLAMVRRSSAHGAGGWWHPGKVFNAVGENCAPRDFEVSVANGERICTPQKIAVRGLHEEVALSLADLVDGRIHLHTLAWAADLLDFKFFGHVITELSSREVAYRHTLAPDFQEGMTMHFVDVSNRAACRKLIRSIAEGHSEWAPEASLCTIRTLLTLRRLRASDLGGI